MHAMLVELEKRSADWHRGIAAQHRRDAAAAASCDDRKRWVDTAWDLPDYPILGAAICNMPDEGDAEDGPETALIAAQFESRDEWARRTQEGCAKGWVAHSLQSARYYEGCRVIGYLVTYLSGGQTVGASLYTSRKELLHDLGPVTPEPPTWRNLSGEVIKSRVEAE